MMKIIIKKNLYLIILTGILTFSFCVPIVTRAEYTMSVSYPKTDSAQLIEEGDAGTRLTNYIKYIHTIGISMVAIAAVTAIVIGGFMYMLSDLVSSKEEGKKWIYGAITGLILALASYLILYTINPDLIILSPPDLSEENPAGEE